MTGAGSGIGGATALALSQAGVQVVAVSRSPRRLLAGGDSAPSGLHLVAADMTEPEAVDSVFADAVATFGAVSYVVHSVGYQSRVGWFGDAETVEILGTVAALVTSPALVLSRAVDTMRLGGGVVCMVSSGAAHRPTPGRPLYSAAKMAMNRMVQSVGAECRSLAPTIGVCAVEPGRVDTPMQRRLMAQADEADPVFELERFQSADGLLEAAAVGVAIAELVRRDAAEVNGRVFRFAQGGWTVAEGA